MRKKRHTGLSAIFKVHSPRKGIVRCAILSRCLIIAISAASNYMIPDHEASDVFLRPEEREAKPRCSLPAVDSAIKILLGGLARWDAQHFLHIANHGYIFENSLAFFPLFPLLVRSLNTVLDFFLADIITSSSIILLSATVINFGAFLAAADVFFTISLRVLDDLKVAYIATLLFCFNPASIFFTAPYSETLFALLSFSGISLMLQSKWHVWSSMVFGLSASTRSNGLLNVGFVLYKKLKYFLTVLWPGVIKPKLLSNTSLSLKVTAKWLVAVILSCVFVFIPFLAFQAEGYYMFCTSQDRNLSHTILNYAVRHKLILPSLGGKASRPADHWCYNQIPFSYSYIQNHYWDVGFLKYFQLKQIPNFLLALPVIVLILSQGLKFFLEHKAVCLRLGFVGKEIKRKSDSLRMSREMFVFVTHAVVLTLFCFFFIHVQVTTRMLFSASPVPCWFGSYIFHEGFVQRKNLVKLKQEDEANKEGRPLYRWKYINSFDELRSYVRVLRTFLTFKAKLLLLYVLSYYFVGAVLFSNFLPWT